MKILISTTTYGEYDPSPINALKDKGLEILTNPYGRKLKPDEVITLAKDCIGIIAGTEPLGKDILEKLSSLKVISRCGTGIDNVDLNTAHRLGIKVYNTPDAPTQAVSELTLALMLNLLRRVSLMDRQVHEGQWGKNMGNLLSGKKVGIIGFGRIGRRVSGLLKPFECEIAYSDPFVDSKEARQMSLEDLLGWADIITLHVSSKETILGKAELSLIKKGAWLINVSRGGVVDEDVLYESLKDGRLQGAALDVFNEEPYKGSLRGLENVILTPHIGSYAVESRIRMEMEAANNLLEGLGCSK